MRSPSGIISASTRARVVLPVPVGPLRMMFSRALTAASRSGTARAGIVPDLHQVDEAEEPAELLLPNRDHERLGNRWKDGVEPAAVAHRDGDDRARHVEPSPDCSA